MCNVFVNITVLMLALGIQKTVYW